MSKSISEQMDDVRQRTKDAYTKGIGTPESIDEQRADNTERAEIVRKCRGCKVGSPDMKDCFVCFANMVNRTTSPIS